MSKPIISAKNLKRSFKQYKKQPGLMGSVRSFFNRKYFEIDAVKGIDLEIKEGEMVGFIGPNGAGKTTTLKMLSGVLYRSSGDLSVLGFNPADRKPEFQKQFALVLGQKSQLWWDLPAVESFILNKEIYEIPTQEYQATLQELSELLEITDILEIPVRKLSLGQRMKCELVASLLHKPRLLFLDEPTIGLDVVVQKNLRNFLKEYNRKYGITMILTSHYMDDVEELCDRIVVISKGEKIYDGGLNSLIEKYANDKYLKVVFNQKVDKDKLGKLGRIIEISEDSLSATLSVPRDTHTSVASELLRGFSVDDLDIAEVNLEEIISNIFETESRTD